MVRVSSAERPRRSSRMGRRRAAAGASPLGYFSSAMLEVELCPGRATPEGTGRFAKRFSHLPGHFRCPDRLQLSSLGLGLRNGEPSGRDELLYRSAVSQLLEGGVNLFATALSERMQKSER